MNEDDGIGLRAFARELGVTHRAVQSAIDSGKIPAACVRTVTSPSGRQQRRIVDPDQARRHWRNNLDPSRVRAAKVLRDGAQRGWAQRRGTTAEPQPPVSTPRAPSAVLPDVAESRKVTEAFKARMAKLEYEEKIGQVVNADGIKVRYTTLIAAAKTKVLAVPSKARSRLPHLTVEDVDLLETLLAEALEELALGR